MKFVTPKNGPYVFKTELKPERREADCNSVGYEFQSSTTVMINDLLMTVLRGEER